MPTSIGEDCDNTNSGFEINVLKRGCLHDRHEMSVPIPYGPEVDRLCIVEHEKAGGPYGENYVCTGCWKAAFPAEQGMCYIPGWRSYPDYRFFKKPKGWFCPLLPVNGPRSSVGYRLT